MEYADVGITNAILHINWLVSCLHNENIIHCDLHSGNILVADLDYQKELRM
ncbi:hypothetical protein C1645_821845 [Glomus cerebriforme]|uniref:Protein kinase domain-containing protein n=1 Tax=Glomus cerebriforme TaxID=658196 RepID=A0A397SZW9_9GLOM|nr:hypothetical protein C1645_821845 [Glomus cerebriforme]